MTPTTSGRVLLVPGFTGSKEDFLTMLVPLARAGYDVAAIDQLGQFESRVTIDSAEAWGDGESAASQLAADLHDACAALWPQGPRPHVVAHSMGGLVARRATIADPTFLSSLTLLGSGPAAIPDHQRPQLQALRQMLPQVSLVDVWNAKRVLDARNGVIDPAPEIQAFLERRWLANSPHGLRAKAGILLTEPDLTPDLRRTGVSTLVAFGRTDDVWWPELQESMAVRLGAPAVAIAGAGHSPNTDNADAVAEALVSRWGTFAARV
jgi:pimeloyl-ACP methyl ester carboxylesterase